MTHRSLERRLAALEAATCAGAHAYAVDVGDEYIVWHGEHIPIDEWHQRYPDAVLIDIGGGGGGVQVVKALRGVHMGEL